MMVRETNGAFVFALGFLLVYGLLITPRPGLRRSYGGYFRHPAHLALVDLE